MKTQERRRGLGRIYQPTYRDRKTGELKNSPTWWIAYSYRGVKHRESSESTSERDAIKLLKKRLGEIGRGQLVGPDAEKVTFVELCAMVLDDYTVNARKSLTRAEQAVQHLKDFFGLARALDVTTDRVNAYIRQRQEAKAANATVQYELAMLKRAFTLAVQAGKLVHKPYIPTLEVHNTREGFFEEADYRAVLEHLPEYLRPVVTFAYLTGWRIPSEVLTLQWRQVDFQAGVVRLGVGSTKNKEGRSFPFTAYPALADLLRRQWDRTMTFQMETETVIPWVFHRAILRTRRGPGHATVHPIGSFYKAWETACTAAGLPDRIPHDFRRTAVRNLERAGVPRSVAMKLTGHKTESVYRRYAVVCEADLSEGVKKLAALSGAQPSGQEARIVPISAGTGKAGAKQAGISG